MFDIKYGESPNPEKVKERLEEAKAKWTEEGWVISDSLDLSELGLTKLPLILKVSWNFNCSNNKLTTLEGSPQKTGCDFRCSHNLLISLKGSSKIIGGDFCCNDNQLVSPKGGPQKVGGDFNCWNNRLTSFEGSPREISGSFYWRNKFTPLDGIGKLMER